MSSEEFGPTIEDEANLTTEKIDSAHLVKLYYLDRERTSDENKLLKTYGLSKNSPDLELNVFALENAREHRCYMGMEGTNLRRCNNIPKDATVAQTAKPEPKNGPKKQDGDETRKKDEEKDPKKIDDTHQFVNKGKPMTTMEELNSAIKTSAVKLDEDLIRTHLESYIKSADLADESYMPNEIKVKYFMKMEEELQPSKLIAAGTKVLDAIIYCSLAKMPKCQGIFDVTEVTGLTPDTASKNVVEGKRAIQAGIVLVYGSGSLPMSSGNSDKAVMKFVKDNIYQGNLLNYDHIGSSLSCCSTKKFPAQIFLKLNLDILPPDVRARCKLSVAGNKAIRYAVYASGFEVAREEVIKEGTPMTIALLLEKKNTRMKLAIELVNFLRTLQTSFDAQVRMHPLSASRNATKNFNAKLTRAVLESLSPNGRLTMVKKIDSSGLGAFKRDENFYGIDDDGVHTWPILQDVEKDFSDLSVSAVKSAYGRD